MSSHAGGLVFSWSRFLALLRKKLGTSLTVSSMAFLRWAASWAVSAARHFPPSAGELAQDVLEANSARASVISKGMGAFIVL